MNYEPKHLPADSYRGVSDRFAPRCWRFVLLSLVVLFAAQVAAAIPLHDYHQHVEQAINSLDLLREDDEGQDAPQRAAFASASIEAARQALPLNEQVEWDGTSYPVNNAWLYGELKDLEARGPNDPSRTIVLDRILERLQAIAERLLEIEKQSAGTGASKGDLKQRLAAILKRSEYATRIPEERDKTAMARLGRLIERFLNWLRSLFPSPPQIAPGHVGTISRTAQIIVIGIALLVIAYVAWLVVPRFLRQRQTRKKKVKAEARIVLGERLQPDESSIDLLADAEALARAGDLRGAIRKGYIALLVELADRRVISLAQYKTNRDYLRAVREHEPLHRNMEKLTSSFEVHWYGLVQASEHDWVDFRAVYRETLNG